MGLKALTELHPTLKAERTFKKKKKKKTFGTKYGWVNYNRANRLTNPLQSI